MAKRGKARRGSIGKCNSALLYVVVCLDAVYFIHTKENPSQRDGQTSSTVKLRNFEKAPKIWKCLPIFLTLLIAVKNVGRFFQIFVAFSEYLNFRRKEELAAKSVLSSAAYWRRRHVLCICQWNHRHQTPGCLPSCLARVLWSSCCSPTLLQYTI